MAAALNPCLNRFKGQPGYFSIAIRKPESDNLEIFRYFTADEILKANSYIQQNADKNNVYYNVATFKERKALTALIDTVKLHYIDIDNHINSMTPAEAREMVKAISVHFNKDIPEPSQIVYTGNGFQVLFDLTGSIDIVKWKLIQEALNLKCDEIIAGYNALLGVENNARADKLTNANRYLRTPGTINTRDIAGTGCRYAEVIYNSGNAYTQDEIIKNYPGLTYIEKKKAHSLQDLDKLNASDILKATKTQLKEFKKYNKAYTEATLNQARLKDYITIINLRNAAGVMEGYRNNLLMLAANTIILQTTKAEEIKKMMADINSLFAKPLTGPELQKWYASNVNSIIKGRRFYHSNGYIINLLGITEAEQKKLLTIIDRKEVNRRYYQTHQDQEKARKKADYLPQKQLTEKCRRIDAKTCQDLKALGCSITDIARQLKLSRPTVYRYLKK